MPAYVTRGAPFTFVIDYADHLNRIDEAAGKLRDAPPTLLHGGIDQAYISRGGASDFRPTPNGGPMPWSIPIGPDAAAERSRAMRRWTDAAHAAGVERVISYICNQSIGGDPDARTGFWEFFDRWEDYSHDVGPKPGADPIDWMQREHDGRLHFNYPYRFVRTSPPLRFAPCPNNPYWHRWLKTVVRLMACEGFDGVFIDNNIIHCRCTHCENAFHDYLRATYTPFEMRRRYGRNPDDLSFATAGDVVLWACARREYLQRIREREPDEFREKFGTDDVGAAVASEAGNGFHWGRAYDYWVDTLRKEHPAEEVDRILREGDMHSRGLRTPDDHCLWADTQKFWGWTIGRRNAEIRAAAEDIRPGFAIVPNWGDFSGFRHTMSRRLDGKNVALWKPGSDIVFFEEEYFPGTVAPGYTLDLLVPYKYACANGMRSCALPYRGSGSRALVELATAEPAVWTGDGAFVQPGYAFPDVRRAYRAFFERHAEWFAGRSSVAEVGVYLSFDEIHFENTHHYREATAIARFLADQHALFDFIPDGGLTAAELRRYALVIVPHAEYLSLAARRALGRRLDEGGGVLVTGDTGAFDENARPVERRRDLLETVRDIARQADNGFAEFSGPGRLVWIDDVFTFLPKREMEICDLADVSPKRLADVRRELRAAPISSDGGRFLELLERLAGTRLSAIENAPDTLRIAVWKRGGRNPSLVAHVINYDVTAADLDPDPAPRPVDGAIASIALPPGMDVRSVVAADPWNPEPAPLDFAVRDGRVRFVLPHVDIYRAVRIA